MFSLNGSGKFYVYGAAVDMRKSFDGLCGLVRGALGADPLNGDVYLFLNRRRDRIKLLVWDRNGFWIFYKRLEKGTFQVLSSWQRKKRIQLPFEELLMLLEGVDLSLVKRRRWYNYQSSVA